MTQSLTVTGSKRFSIYVHILVAERHVRVVSNRHSNLNCGVFLFVCFCFCFVFGLFRTAPWSYGHLPMTEPQQHGVWVMSVTYTTAHGNAGSLTCWARPGIKPMSSWLLIGCVNHWATMRTPTMYYIKIKFCWWSSMEIRVMRVKTNVNLKRSSNTTVCMESIRYCDFIGCQFKKS